jgi:hypothetical protein
MRGGVRLVAVTLVAGTLAGASAGCSDPSGAVRKERAAARKSAPSPSTSQKPAHRAATWWQAPGGIKTANGLKVHTGPLRTGLMRVSITDVNSGARRVLTATARAHGAMIGQFTLTGIKLAKSAKTGTYGVTFHYRHH